MGGGKNADGGGGGCVCVGGVEMVECEMAGEEREEGEAAENPKWGYCGPPEKGVRD